MSWEVFGIWAMAFLTLCILSFLYKDNPFYKFAEHLYVGISAAYGAVIVYMNTIKPDLIDKIIKKVPEVAGDASTEVWKLQEMWFVYLIPLLLCFMIFTKMSQKYSWMARWPLAFVMGAYAGSAIPAIMGSDVITQVRATMIDLTQGGPGTIISNVILIIGVCCGLVYFFFSKPHSGPIGYAAKVGIWFLMISFGASFGYTVMARVSLAIGRADELIENPVPSVVSIALIVVGLGIYSFISPDKEEGSS